MVLALSSARFGISAAQVRPYLPQPLTGDSRFQLLSNEQVASYATPLPAGNSHARFYTTPDPSGRFNWFFSHREIAKGAVHVLPIVTDAKGRQFLHAIIQKAPVMGGRPIVQLPAGTWGDNNPQEAALAAAKRELKEETGYDVKSATVFGPQLFATSPGITTEQKAFALAKVTGEPSDQFQEPQEKVSIIGRLNIPLSTIRNYSRFMNFISVLNDKGYTVGMDILAARALLPPARQLDAMA